MHASCCWCYYSTCIHCKWSVNIHVATLLWQLFCDIVTLPSMLMPISQTPAWMKDATFNTHLTTTAMINHPTTGWEKMPFHFLQPLTLCSLFISSITLLQGYPDQHGYLGSQPKLKYDTFNTLLPISTSCIYHECRVSKNVLPSFCYHFLWLTFIFSTSLLCGHPHICAHLRPQTDLEIPFCASWCQQQHFAATGSIGWEKTSFPFFYHFSVSCFFNTLLFNLCYNDFGVAQFQQQSKWAYVGNYSTISQEIMMLVGIQLNKEKSSAATKLYFLKINSLQNSILFMMNFESGW